MMTAIELRTSIATDLNLLSTEMLENVSQYVKRLVKHSRAASTPATITMHKTIEITPGVARLRTGHTLNASDEEREQMRYEYLTKKYK